MEIRSIGPVGSRSRGSRTIPPLSKPSVLRRTLFTPTRYFDRVQRFCFFIAPARSGHSIVAHLLSAHPDVLIGDEVDVLHYINEGYSASRLYALCRWKDIYFQRHKRIKSGYDYAVPGTAQGEGRKKHPLVIGGAKGGASTRILASDPGVIDRLRAEVGVPLRVIFHVRHPFDVMATKIRRHPRSVRAAAEGIRKLASRLENAFDLMQDDERLFQTHEELIAEPKAQFERLFRFLDVEPIPEIVEACAGKVWKAPHKTRTALQWEGDDDEARLVEDLKKTRFFASYFAEA
jgi:hypothetical protein